MNNIKQVVDTSDESLEDIEAKMEECDEQLVRSFIQKITVCDEQYEVEFKAGITIDIEK